MRTYKFTRVLALFNPAFAGATFVDGVRSQDTVVTEMRVPMHGEDLREAAEYLVSTDGPGEYGCGGTEGR